MQTAVIQPKYKCIKVIWTVEVGIVHKGVQKGVRTKRVTTYYRPGKEKEDVALEAIPYLLDRSEKLLMIILKDKQPEPYDE